MGTTTYDTKDIFPWSKELKKEIENKTVINFVDIIDKVVRVDITYSKGLNGKLAWYDSAKYHSKSIGDDTENAKNDAKNDINSDWNGYDEALVDFGEKLKKKFGELEKRVPIDFLTKEEKKKSWYSFKVNGQNVRLMTSKPTNFVQAQGDLSYRIFNKTRIKQIIVFPNFTQEGFGSNCIVALSEVIDDSLIFVLMAECVGYSYKSSLEEFSTLLRKEAIKSAKAAIMSRNISHNLGSHVMAYMKQSLGSVEDMLKNGVLMYAHQKDEKLDYEIPYLVGVGRFLSYLQERQDYIATVSTDYIPYPSVVNFKDAIYDELNPDYRFQRHTEWAGHKPANILLENIAKSEGLSRRTLNNEKQTENNIIIQYGKFDGLNQDDANADYNRLRQWNFSLPGGIMGRQAVFSIVENVIRNAAKHGSRGKGENLSVVFEIIDPLVDTESVKEEYKKEDLRGLYIVKLTTSDSITDKNLKTIKDAIKDSLIEDNGQLKQSNKGIKEMLISAAWLRNIKIEDYGPEQIEKKAPILEANMVDGKLQYVFCLPKVKEVALITERFTEEDLNKKKVQNQEDEQKETVAQLMKIHGWYVYSVNQYLSLPDKNFNFVVIDPKLGVVEEKDGKELDAEAKEKENGLLGIVEEIRMHSHNRYYIDGEVTDLNRRLIKTKLFDETEGLKSFKSNDCFEKAELNLYAQLANVAGDFEIGIADIDPVDKSGSKIESKTDRVKIIKDEEKADKSYKYIYRKHNDTIDCFRNFVELYGKRDFSNNLLFVEGITGGNSTDRLVRHTDLDNLWAYKQIHAMTTRVAVFDERIFTKVTGYEMTDLNKSPQDNWKSKLGDVSDVEEAKKQILNSDYSSIIVGSLYVDFTLLDNLQDVIDFAEKNCPISSSVASKDNGFNPMIFHKKGIDTFTLVWETGKMFSIWGFVPDESDDISRMGSVNSIGTLEIDDNGQVDISMNRNNKYHYLSIHQGLLDKIYEKYVGISADVKKNVTSALYDSFIMGPRNEKNDYLQGLIIHSGRSKPNEKDMPQHQPFVQYSAVENAIFDCKYTLVELLDFACFE